jgi:hypothetical protein
MSTWPNERANEIDDWRLQNADWLIGDWRLMIGGLAIGDWRLVILDSGIDDSASTTRALSHLAVLPRAWIHQPPIINLLMINLIIINPQSPIRQSSIIDHQSTNLHSAVGNRQFHLPILAPHRAHGAPVANDRLCS